MRSKWRGIKNRSMVCLIRCSRQLKEGGMSETQGQRLFQVCIGRCADNLEQDSSSCCDTLTADIPCVVYTETTSGATSPKISFWVKMFGFKRATVFLCGTPLLRVQNDLDMLKIWGGLPGCTYGNNTVVIYVVCHVNDVQQRKLQHCEVLFLSPRHGNLLNQLCFPA